LCRIDYLASAIERNQMIFGRSQGLTLAVIRENANLIKPDTGIVT